MLSLRDSLQTLISVDPRRFAVEFHSVAKQASFETQYFSIFWRFLSPSPPKMEPTSSPKSNFWHFFAILFSTTLSDRFFSDFSRAETLKSSILLRKNNDFHYIDVFAKAQKKLRFWIHFERSKPWKIYKNACLKTLDFLTSFLERCFATWERFWLHFGRPWGLQKLKKMVKNRSGTCLGCPLDALSLQGLDF